MFFDNRTIFDLTRSEIFTRYSQRLLITLSILILPLLLLGVLLKPSTPAFALLILIVIALGRKKIASVLHTISAVAKQLEEGLRDSSIILEKSRPNLNARIDKLENTQAECLERINEIKSQIDTFVRIETLEEKLDNISSNLQSIKFQAEETPSPNDKNIVTLKLEDIEPDEIDFINVDLINRGAKPVSGRPSYTTVKAKRVAARTFTVVNKRSS